MRLLFMHCHNSRLSIPLPTVGKAASAPGHFSKANTLAAVKQRLAAIDALTDPDDQAQAEEEKKLLKQLGGLIESSSGAGKRS